MPVRVRPIDEGIAVEWESATTELRGRFRDECLVTGLLILSDSPQRTVLDRYRNEFETLELVQQALQAIDAAHTVDARFDASRRDRDLELARLEQVRQEPTPEPVDRRVHGFVPERLLFDYQALAVAKHLLAGNAADFSVPGSGKTTTALATWAHARREETDLGLWIVGPLSSFRPWEEEFEACFGRPPNVLRLQGSGADRRRLARESHRYELVLCSYHCAWRSAAVVREAMTRRPRLLVLDEAHYIKNPSGVLAAAVRELAPYARRRMILTGTPMPRDPIDIWSQFTFLWPSEGLLGNFAQHELLCRRPTPDVVTELRGRVGPFFHRTCKSDMGLPEPVGAYPVIPAEEVPATQRLIIRLLERQTLEEFEYLSARDRRHLARWRRARLVRLMQAASNPLLLAAALTDDELGAVDEADATDGPQGQRDAEALDLSDPDGTLSRAISRYASSDVLAAKIDFIERRCREIVADGHKVVIWTVFLGNVQTLAERLADLDPLAITGAVPLYDDADDEQTERSRESRVRIFKSDPDRPVLIANMGACSESISLHRAAQHALYLERNFNAAQFVQSLDRIHRQGMPPGTTAMFEIPSVPCAVERVLNRRLRLRQQRLYELLDDPMPVVGFDDEAHRGFFDVEAVDDLDALFEEVLAEIRSAADGED